MKTCRCRYGARCSVSTFVKSLLVDARIDHHWCAKVFYFCIIFGLSTMNFNWNHVRSCSWMFQLGRATTFKFSWLAFNFSIWCVFCQSDIKCWCVCVVQMIWSVLAWTRCDKDCMFRCQPPSVPLGCHFVIHTAQARVCIWSGIPIFAISQVANELSQFSDLGIPNLRIPTWSSTYDFGIQPPQ